MSYIGDLRKYVGHAPLISVGATTLVFNNKNELLLNLRSDTNNWGIPGGAKELNETLEKFLETKGKYTLTIITGRDRDSIGEITKETFDAKNDLEALLYVFENYKLQNAGMFNGDYEDDELEDEDIELKNNILNCVKEEKVEEGIKLLTDLYFDNFDISDYYDDIVSLEGSNGIVIEDDIDLADWDDDELDTEDYEDD